jgi:hypothetical protein
VLFVRNAVFAGWSPPGMSLLNPPVDKPQKPLALAFTIGALILAVALVLWFTFRYYPEKKATEHFFDAVVAGDTDRAYALWKASDNYKMKDFLADWGPAGYYGPVKSYRVMGAKEPDKSGSIEVNVAISPFSPLPDASDADKSRKTKMVTLWVQPSDKSFSFPP